MTTTYFTSDLHLGHRMVAELRGFKKPKEHDEAICDLWAASVRKDDAVWVLGDLALKGGRAAVGEILATIAKLPGVKHLIAGNHDPVHPMHRDSHTWQALYMETFGSVQAFARKKIAGESVLLSHFPYGADHTENARYDEYRLRPSGLRLIHGHTHSPVRHESELEFHVGLDAWQLRPVPLSEVENWMGL